MERVPHYKGSDEWHVIVFKPNCREFRADPHLYVCENEYGSCELFHTYHLKTKQLERQHLRSDNQEATSTTDDSTTSVDFVVPGTYCALAADPNAIEDQKIIKQMYAVYIIKV